MEGDKILPENEVKACVSTQESLSDDILSNENENKHDNDNENQKDKDNENEKEHEKEKKIENEKEHEKEKKIENENKYERENGNENDSVNEELTKKEIKVEDEDENQFGLYTITQRNMYIIFLSLVLCVVDIGSDVYVGIKYANERYIMFSIFTFVFIFFPSVIINYFWGYRTLEIIAERGSIKYKVIYGLSTFFCITPFIQYCLNIKTLILYFKSTHDKIRQKQLYQQFNLGNDLAVCQKLWETLFEAMPQLALQCFIMFKYMDCFNWNDSNNRLIYSQLTSVLTSSIGVFAVAFSWYRANRLARGWYASIIGAMLHSVARAFPIICRLISIGASMTYDIYLTLLLLVVHWILGGVWYWFKLLKNPKRGAVWGALVVFTPYCFTVKQCLIQNIVLHLANIGLILIWSLNTCYQRLFVIVIICSIVFVDAIFRIVHVFQMKFENKFLVKNNGNEENDSVFKAENYFQKNVIENV